MNLEVLLSYGVVNIKKMLIAVISWLRMFVIGRMGEALCAYIEKDRPFLGICLGLQLLFESSDENGPGNVFNSCNF